MNLSGDAVRQLLAKYELDAERDLVLIYDDLDFPLGTLKIRERGGPGTHNGVDSVIASIGTQRFARLRLGIGSEKQGKHREGYVLKQFRAGERKKVGAVMELAQDAVEAIVKDGLSAAMNRFNQSEEAKAKEAAKKEAKKKTPASPGDGT